MEQVFEEVMNERAAALRLGLSPRSLQRMRLEGGGPPFVRLSERRIAYTATALRAWLTSRECASTSCRPVAKAVHR